MKGLACLCSIASCLSFVSLPTCIPDWTTCASRLQICTSLSIVLTKNGGRPRILCGGMLRQRSGLSPLLSLEAYMEQRL